jgi:hypothetical protein
MSKTIYGRAARLAHLLCAPAVLIPASEPGIIRARGNTRDVAFTYRMPAGIPGDVNLMDPANPVTAYGLAVAMDSVSYKIRPIGVGDTVANVYGVLARPFPANAQTAANFFGSVPLGTPAVPPVNGVVDILKRDYMTVLLNGAVAAAPNGLVYVRVATPAAGKPLGGFEAAADGGNTIVMPAGTYFRGPADAGGNTEIAWRIG